jgi:capsular exopolysaccharide synthesis family protein
MQTKIESAHLRDYLIVLRKRKRAFIGTLVAILFVITAYTFLSTPLYEGATKIIIEKVNQDRLTGRTKDTYEDPEIFYETQYQLITSRAVAYRVIETLSLVESYETVSPGQGKGLMSMAAAPVKWIKGLLVDEEAQDSAGNGSRTIEDQIADELIKNLSVSPVKGSRITAIQFLSPNPEFSALVANTYAKAYIQETLNMKLEATRRNLEWMTGKAEKERRKLDEAEGELQTYMKENDLVTLENQVAIIPKQLTQLGEDLVRAEATRKELGHLHEKIQGVSKNLDAAESILSINEGTTLEILRAQILKAEQTVMELSGKYGSKHPAMKKARGDLSVLRNKRKHEIRRIIQKVEDQYDLALSNEQSLRTQLERLKSDAISINEQYTQYDVLNRELETNRKLYETLLAKIKDQSITGETHPVNLWIVENAEVALKAKKPRKLLNLLFGLVLGTICGVGLAFFSEYFDNTIKQPIDAENALGIPLLGVVASHGKDASDYEKIVQRDPKSISAECYRSLRTSLMLSTADEPPKKIVITSPRPGEGKTTTATNLALALAQAGKRVLLIDGDLRRPRIHKIFRQSSANGLSAYLAGKVKEPSLKKTDMPNLTILTAGPIPPNPSELLTSNRLKVLIDALSESYDTIICDSAPILSVTDTRILSRVFDATILVVMGGKTTYAMGSLGVKFLKEANAKVLGMVINALDLKKHVEYYHDYYEYEPEAKP